ncbi:MAG: Spy/CpxP family protein refolding chaperone [Breznakibacter sp.]
MKKITILYMAIMGFVFIQATVAQQEQARFPVLRERIANAKVEYIKEKLALDDAQTEKFRTVYLAYEREQAQLGKLRNLRMNNVNADSIPAEDAEKLIAARFDFAQKQLDLRKKYFTEFQKVLSPQQIIKLYQAETEIRQKVLIELRNRRQTGRLQQEN